jgi:glycosyltransferase involved in cell wall biosynthesis
MKREQIEPPLFSVVIPTYQRREILASTLRTVFAQDFPPQDYEVIVVVDGSTDETAEYLRSLAPACSLRILEQPNRGPAAARNSGLRSARGKLVLFLDDDILCDSTLLSRHAAVHRERDPVVVFGPVMIAEETPKSIARDWMDLWLGSYLEMLEKNHGPLSPADVWIAQNCSAPRDVLLAHGGYDEDFPWAFEDMEFAIRIWDAGVPFHFAPEVVTRQVYAKLADDLVCQDAPRFGRSEVRLCRKHPWFRSRSILARFAQGSALRRLALYLAYASPIPLEACLRPMSCVAEYARSVPMVRRMGVRMLKIRMTLAWIRAAVEEAGSYEAILAEFAVPSGRNRRKGSRGSA